MSCTVCHRAARGYGYTPRRRDPFAEPPAPCTACSMRCLDILFRRNGHVLDLPHFEKQALDAASDAAGQHLERIGKTDLATMTGEEWHELLALIFVTAAAKIQRLTEEDAVPF